MHLLPTYYFHFFFFFFSSRRRHTRCHGDWSSDVCSSDLPVSSQRYPSRLESRAGFLASTREECLSPRVRLECNPEIPVAPGEEHWLLDPSLEEVYWPCRHSRAIPSFPSQLEWKIGLAWANTRGSLNSPSSLENPAVTREKPRS